MIVTILDPLLGIMIFFLLFMLVFVILLVATAFVSLYLRVPFAPTHSHALQAVVNAFPLRTTDLVYDLGSGDGRLVFALRKEYGCPVVGFELTPFFFLWSVLSKVLKGISGVHFLMRDFLKEDLRAAQVLYCYLTPGMLDRLAEKIEKDQLHTVVISHSFAIHRWQPWQTLPKDEKAGTPAIYIYKT